MSLKETFQLEIKTAMQKKEVEKLSVLRMVLAAVINKEKQKRAKTGEECQLTDEEVLEVITSEAKKRKDSIEQFEKGNRQDLADQEKSELKILEEYLPEQMSEDEVRKIITDKIQELGVSGPQDIGKVMGAIMGQLKGKANGGLVNKIVQEELKK